MPNGMNDGSRRRACAAAIALAAALTACAGPATARGVRREAPPQERLLPAAAGGPVTIVVSTDSQRLTVYDGESRVAQTPVSTGVPEHPTPHGVFSIIEKQVFHRSNLYSDAPMPFMQRLTWSGVALHEGHVTGRPASHGCVRLPQAFARELFRYTRRGARVIIAREDVTPAPIFGLAQFSPPSAARAGAGVEVVGLPGEIEQPAPQRTDPSRKAARNIVAESPVTALINRKTGKIYVRRAFAPIFEAPITIDEPNRRLGAHLFVAHAAGFGGEMSWSAVSVPGRTREAMLELNPQNRTSGGGFGVSPVFEPSASEALRRIHLAPGPAARLSALLAPGAALIISDEGARGTESWAGTNFIALVE
jgi:hypothetical protein